MSTESLYHILKIDGRGGVSYVTSRAKGTSPAVAVVRLAEHEARVSPHYPLIAEGDTVMVLRAAEGGAIVNPNMAQSIFKVGRVQNPQFTATPVSL